MVTLSALACVLMSFYFTHTKPFDNEKENPTFYRAGFFIALFFVNLYELLDALDGKHARNTAMSSPIGKVPYRTVLLHTAHCSGGVTTSAGLVRK